MEIKVLSKPIEDYPKTGWIEQRIVDSLFSDGKNGWNVRAIKNRLSDDFEREVYHLFVMKGNEFATTDTIIARVRVMMAYEILTKKQWQRAIPIIERGIEANRAYVDMLNEMSPILERYCKEYTDVNMRYTFMERVPLECWQGRFSEHTSNLEQRPNYK